MNNVVRLRTPRIPPRIMADVPLYQLSVTRAKALGICPEPSNDTGAATREPVGEGR